MAVTEMAAATMLPAASGLYRPGRPASWNHLVEVVLGFNTLAVACVLSLIAVAIPHTMADPDIWWHLRNAQDMLTQHAFVRHDTFSFTANGSPWIDHEWLAELPFLVGWRAAGASGVYLVTAALIEGIFGGLFFLCWRASRSLVTASVATVTAALLSTVSFGPRTLLCGWLCLVLELIVLEELSRRSKAVFLLPLLFCVWVNLHGSWVIGLSVLAMYTVFNHVRLPGEWLESSVMTRQQLHRLLWSWLLILPALFCNPWGWRLVAYPFNLAFHQTLNIANVQEWHSLDLHSLRGRVVVAVLVLLAGRQLYQPRRWSLVELCLLFTGLWSALNYSRFLFLLALLAAPIVARSFTGKLLARRVEARPGLNALMLAALLTLLVFTVRKNAREPDMAMEQFPVRALPALGKLDSKCRLFNEFLWGGYLEWHTPGRAVFIDSRIDIFEYNGTFKDYLDIVQIKNTIALLDRHGIGAVFFEKNTPLVYLLQRAGGWVTRYDDGQNVLLQRTPVVRPRAPLTALTQVADKLGRR